MGCIFDDHELGAARLAYNQQIKYGSGPETALDFAVLGYLKQNRHVAVSEARATIADALGIEHVEQTAFE